MVTETQMAFIARNKLRFFTGFGIISVFMGIVSFGMALVTMVTVKGIYIPAWVIIIVGGGLVAGCWYFGYWYEMTKMWEKEISHTNKNINPEMLKMCTETTQNREDIIRIKALLEETLK